MSAPLPEAETPAVDGVDPLQAAIEALAPLRVTQPVHGLGARLDALEGLAESLLQRDGASVPGAAFLAAFLRRQHVDELLRREMPDPSVLERFVATGQRTEMRIYPRGAVCHWIAGNVPLLGVFSWALSALFGNVNLVRISSRNEDVLSPLVERIAAISPAGQEMAERTRVVSFGREDTPRHEIMSRFADLRIAWGGEEAVSAVRGLPARWECDDLVFGPRRSFAVVDPATVDERVLVRLANDIVYFDQLACSSPQVVFVRRTSGADTSADFAGRLSVAVEAGAARFRRHSLDWGETYLIELDRQRAILEGGQVHRDAATQWTVAVLEAPAAHISCANRFVQVVPYSSPEEIAAFMPANVQTVIVAAPEAHAREVAESLGPTGVCRFPRPGMGNNFELPWDGIAVTPRLGRWVTRAT